MFKFIIINLIFLVQVLAIAQQNVEKINGTENLPAPIQKMIYEEQVLNNGEARAKYSNMEVEPKTNLNAKYFPSNQPKFALPYYLIPQEEAEFIEAESLSSEVKSQLYKMGSDGKRYFKLFVHPESEKYYQKYAAKFKYVGPSETEFVATPTSSFRSLITWNLKTGEKPFIAKVSIDKDIIEGINRLVSNREVIRSVSIQKALQKVGEKKLSELGFKYFPETAGLVLKNKSVGGQIIRELPDEVIGGERKWVSWATITSQSKQRAAPLVEMVKKNNMSSYEFLDQIMIDSYMNMFEKVSFENGFNFEPHSQNLCFELTADGKITGNWVLRDFGGMYPDVITILKNGGPIEEFMQPASVYKFKTNLAVTDYISSYVFFYKRQVFKLAAGILKDSDPTLSNEKVKQLTKKLDLRFLNLINKKFNLNLTLRELPNASNYTEFNRKLSAEIPFSLDEKLKEIPSQCEVNGFIKYKLEKNEWVEFFKSRKDYKYYANEKVLFIVSNGKIAGFGLFTQKESTQIIQSGIYDWKAMNKRENIFERACNWFLKLAH